MLAFMFAASTCNMHNTSKHYSSKTLGIFPKENPFNHGDYFQTSDTRADAVVAAGVSVLVSLADASVSCLV